MNPDVMLFDEVTAALDPETVKGVLVTIRELAEDGMTCMIVTHEMGFAREVADQVYFTDGGVLVEHGPPKEFFANPRDPRTRQFLDQILLRRHPSPVKAGEDGRRLDAERRRPSSSRSLLRVTAHSAFNPNCLISAPQRSVSSSYRR